MMEKGNSHVENRIQAMLDGELAEQDVTMVREHCDVCSRCARALEELLAVREMLSGDTPAPMLRPLWPEMAHRLSKTRSTGYRLTFALATAAALTIGVSLGSIIGQSSPSETVQTENDLWSTFGSTLTGDSSTLSSIYLGGLETEGEREQ